jgi:hypothetical protein
VLTQAVFGLRSGINTEQNRTPPRLCLSPRVQQEERTCQRTAGEACAVYRNPRWFETRGRPLDTEPNGSHQGPQRLVIRLEELTLCAIRMKPTV